MPLNRALIGRTYHASETYEVSREIIRRFAEAIGDPHPAYLDVGAARALGHPDVIAPPTFLTVLRFRFGDAVPLTDPELGLDYSLVVHGEQRFVHHRPVRAGDVLSVVSTLDDVRDAGRNELVISRTAVSSGDELVCDVYHTAVSRGTAAGAPS